MALRWAARGPPPRRAKTGLVGNPGPSAERNGLFSFATRHLFLSARRAPLGNVAGLFSVVPRCGTGRIEFQGLFAAFKKCAFLHPCFRAEEKQESQRVNEPLSNVADFSEIVTDRK